MNVQQAPSAFKDLKIPRDAVRYILLQRPGVRRLRPLAKIFKIPYQFYLNPIEALLREKKVTSYYVDTLQKDFDEISAHLPPGASAVLDIGCGIAGIDAMLARHHRFTGEPVFYLLDKTEIASNLFYGFTPRGSFYSSLEAARSTMIANGAKPHQVRTLSADDRFGIAAPDQSFDAVWSLYSWGFHYPVSTYLDEVYRKLKRGGLLIVDVRKKSDGQKELEQKFGKLQRISETAKKTRWLAVKE